MSRHLLVSLSALFLCVFSASAQTPTIQDCLGAIPVCQQVYMEDISAIGSGNFQNEINTAISCTAGELNSIWYIFTANEDGNLGFVITPNNQNDDYDWALYDLTNATCSQISSNPSLQVSCNAAGGATCHGETGATGATNFDEQGAGCGSNPPNQFSGFNPFNALVPMQAGNTYALMVSNWTGSPNGYTIDFGLSTGLGIIDETAPAIGDIMTPTQCDETTIQVEFSEFIQCSTIDADNFQLTGPGGPYTLSLSSGSCDAGGDQERNFTLTISPPIASRGDFSLDLVTNGSTEVLDLCNNPAQSFTYDFSISDPIDVTIELGGDTSLLCDGNTLVLDASGLGMAYQWSDNSTEPTLAVTTGGIYGVTVENVCGFGSDSLEVLVQFEPPVIELGVDQVLCPEESATLDVTNDLATYLWQDGFTGPVYEVDQEGLYSVEVTNACGTVADEVDIELVEVIDLEMGPDQVLCEGETLSLNFSNPDATFLWQDGSTNPNYTISTGGMYAITVTTVCEVQEDSFRVTYIDEPTLTLGPDTLLCTGQSLLLDLTVPGASYQWQDGSGLSTYTIDQTGTYRVSVTTACNLFTDEIEVIVLDSIRTDLGRDTFFCPGESIILDASAGTIADYAWQDGSSQATFVVKEAGEIFVNVFNICEAKQFAINIKECERCDVFVPTAFSPNDDGVNDFFQPFSDCELADFSMRIFDRWGAFIYETTDPFKGWNGEAKGKSLDIGIYVWFMEFTVVENNRPRKTLISGDIAIMR
ncbi:MAG: hypothetical protein DHS20C18_50940 [Saprospiraceae bacterium]|nr:MAG: hypothetical protein DHS20C18_50940 [Saprospiraceae bacterium]